MLTSYADFMTLVYFTANDKIVGKAIRALYAQKYSRIRDTPLMVGGMAIQLHCRDMQHALRPTSDIDVAYLPEIADYKAFSAGIGKNIADSLITQGYQVQLKKRKGTPLYEVKIMNGQGNKAKELFFIHFDKLFPEAAKDASALYEREQENAVEVLVAEDSIGLIKRVEDIVPHKLRRVRTMLNKLDGASDLERALYELADAGSWSKLANTPIEPWLTNIINVQNNLEHASKSLPQTYVLSKDLYDICLLARKIEGTAGSFNRSYYSKAKREVESLYNH
jgi:hypothetical protein